MASYTVKIRQLPQQLAGITYFVGQSRPETHRAQVPYTYFAISRACGSYSTSTSTGKIYELNGFNALAFGMTAECSNNLPFAKTDNADTTRGTSDHSQSRSRVDTDGSNAIEIESGILGCQLEYRCW
jgi:hypothetical protein